MSTIVVEERADSEVAKQLIEELEAVLEPLYPSESRHGYSVEKLLRQGVAFFVVQHDGAAAGCGGIQLFGSDYGELKRMYVRPAFRGRGLGKRLVEHLEAHAITHGVGCVRLETGIHQHEAIGLYERMGFARTGPFGDYWDDPLSRFYEKRLAPRR